MKTNQFLLISISALLLALIFVDAWWTALLGQFLANVVLYPIALVFPTALKKVLLSSCTVGNGFSAIVYIGANFPSVWKVASDSFLSASTPSEHQFLPCPPGNSLFPKVGHIPSSNGCGADDVKIGKQYLPYEDQEVCCHQHDVCYDTCHVYDTLNQTLCDLNFKDCLNQICTAKEWRWSFFCPFSFFLTKNYWDENCEMSMRIDREKKCHAGVEVLYQFVHSLGASAYANAQKQACVCIPDDQIGLPIVGFFLGGVLVVLLFLALLFVLRKKFVDKLL